MNKTSSGKTGPTLLTQSIESRKGLIYHIYKRRGQVPFLLLSLAPVVLFFLFNYLPMFGLSIAFQDYKLGAPFFGEGAKWVGFKHFKQMFSSYMLGRLIKNTLILSSMHLAFGMPAAVGLALIINELRLKWFRKFTSTISLLPYFLSIVVVIALMRNLFSTNDGVVNQLLVALGFEKINFLGSSEWFRTLHVGSGLWSGTGFSAVVYSAAIAGIDPELYDAAAIDGSTRWKNIFHITIPCIMPTLCIMLILNLGGIMSVGFEKIILMYSPSMYDVADVLSTYVYRVGLLNGRMSYTTAIDIFNTLCNLAMLITANVITKKLTGEGI